MSLLSSNFSKNAINLFLALGLSICASSANALTDIYFVTGEDLDFLIETDKTYAMEELEYELRKIPFFREVEDFIFNLQDDYIPEGE